MTEMSTMGALLSGCALYMRVSTGRQAEKQLSLPDQRLQLCDVVVRLGGVVVDEFTDTKSGTTSNRPELQRLEAIVDSGAANFQTVLVHSFSRLFRNVGEAEVFVQKLRKRGIEIVSITQPLPAGPAGDLMRAILMGFDQYQSAETGKHVERSMRENARQGFWGGGTPPYGYKTDAAGTRGNTIKKKLAVEPLEAANVRLIFQLYQTGDGSSGPLGVKKVTEWLNQHGFRNRSGSKWSIGKIHKILTDTTHIGTFQYGRTSKSGESVPVPVPAIISQAIFDEVQSTLRDRNPKKTPPRLVSSPILLSGLATCGCGAGMSLRTGKSGRYRYYLCSSKIRKGLSTCPSGPVPMDDLDRLVTDHIVQELLAPDRMRAMLEGLLKRQTARDHRRNDALATLREKQETSDQRLKRLYRAVADGVMDPSEPTLKLEIATITAERDLARNAIERATAELLPSARITEQRIADFTSLMRSNITKGPVNFRRAYLRAIIREIKLLPDAITIVANSRPDVSRAA